MGEGGKNIFETGLEANAANFQPQTPLSFLDWAANVYAEKTAVVHGEGKFTYREFAYLNNARQVPMLPDWAVVDLRSPPTSQYPGKIVDADFFGERWQLRAPRRSSK